MRKPTAIRVLVSTVLFALLLTSGLVVSAGKVSLSLALSHTLALILGFWVPAQWVEAPGHIRRRWKPLLALLLIATAGWDFSTAFLAQHRPFLSEWYLVYSAGPVLLLILLYLHGGLTRLLVRLVAGSSGESIAP